MTVPASRTPHPVADRVRSIVGELAPRAPGLILDSHRLADDLDFDSLALIELAVALEKEFALPPIPEQAAMGVVNVGDLVALVERLRAGQPR